MPDIPFIDLGKMFFPSKGEKLQSTRMTKRTLKPSSLSWHLDPERPRFRGSGAENTAAMNKINNY
jgi:hypothetical protein